MWFHCRGEVLVNPSARSPVSPAKPKSRKYASELGDLRIAIGGDWFPVGVQFLRAVLIQLIEAGADGFSLQQLLSDDLDMLDVLREEVAPELPGWKGLA